MQMGVSYKVVYPEKFLKAQARREKEIVGTLRGFDAYVNMVLEDVTEYDITPEGRVETKVRTGARLQARLCVCVCVCGSIGGIITDVHPPLPG